ncbi:squalene/phytoene synthase family protein [Sphingorhabdus sp.]|uniref:squalene/phytoene synthase family protein n=1 Tax=Sphingorhabdus sp. TaxID=1902408 RepID=UPI00391A2080
MSETASQLPPPATLAIAYVPQKFRAAFALLLQIDARLEDIVHNAREPMIAQIKIAWWREAFSNEPPLRPKGEPLLQALNDTNNVIPLAALEALVSAWESLLGIDVWNQAIVDQHIAFRAEAIFETYAAWLGSPHSMADLGRAWALDALGAAFPGRVSTEFTVPKPPVPKARALRPLSILAMSVRTDSGPRIVWHALTGL